jgi:hypothetical protein
MQAEKWQAPGRQAETGLARFLGWFSVGLGTAELLAPTALARLIGVRQHDVLLRALGMRELASGLGIFSGGRPAGWLWSRVGGDVMDLALLGLALRSVATRRDRLALAIASVAGVMLLDILASRIASERR